jgi:hypothetical protein
VRSFVRLLVLVAAMGLAGAASADGDPASDVLLDQTTFTPGLAASATSLKALEAVVDAVDARGDRVKVAVIAARSDLGSVPSLFGQPQNYATFLAAELSAVYQGPLLIVMRAGFGFIDAEKKIPAADTALATVSTSEGSADGLTLAAARALPELEQAGVLHYKDTAAPLGYPSPGKSAAGHALTLRYQAWDDSGRVKVDIRIQNAHGIVVAHFAPPIRKVSQGAWYSIKWLVPKTFAHRQLSFCLQVTDPAGNHSQRSCAKLTID